MLPQHAYTREVLMKLVPGGTSVGGGHTSCVGLGWSLCAAL